VSSASGLGSSAPLFDDLAADYDAHFQVPHRRLYDELAWERLESLLTPGGGLVVDAGCGVGRWSRKLLARGHKVIGIEQSLGMLDQLRRNPLGPGFTLVAGAMEDVTREDIVASDDPGADAVLAMGSLQYTRDPEAMVDRMASWLRPGGLLMVLVDSLVGLVLELLGAGRQEEALNRLSERRGVWRVGERAASLHLLDRDRLVGMFLSARLVDVTAAGLLVSMAPLGRDGLFARADSDYNGLLYLERQLAGHTLLADAGKQLLVTGRLGR
jgi:SAM-dependent methyltransferase